MVNYRRLASQKSQLEFARLDDTRGSIFESWLMDYLMGLSLSIQAQTVTV